MGKKVMAIAVEPDLWQNEATMFIVATSKFKEVELNIL